MNAAKNFNRMPILLAISLGLVVIGGAAYFATRQRSTPLEPLPANAPVAVAPALKKQPENVSVARAPYTSDGKNVYCDGVIVSGADPKTFTLIAELYNPYGKDATQVYLEERLIPGADPATFTAISDRGDYGKDAAHVYLGTTALPGADPRTFTVLAGGFEKDARQVYYGENVFAEADARTFSIIADNNGAKNRTVFAKDATHVFYEGGWGQVKPSVIAGADPKTFVTLDKDDYCGGYAKDAHAVYWGDTPVSGADPATFQSMAPYGKDAHAVYLGASVSDYFPGIVKQLTGADPKTFVVLPIDAGTNDGSGYAKDAHTVYLYDRPIPGADPTTFAEAAPNDPKTIDTKDKNHGYSLWDIVY